MEHLSQEEIELLMSGELSNEETNKILDKDERFSRKEEEKKEAEVDLNENLELEPKTEFNLEQGFGPETDNKKIEEETFSDITEEVEFLKTDDIDRFFEELSEDEKVEETEEKQQEKKVQSKPKEKSGKNSVSEKFKGLFSGFTKKKTEKSDKTVKQVEENDDIKTPKAKKEPKAFLGFLKKNKNLKSEANNSNITKEEELFADLKADAQDEIKELSRMQEENKINAENAVKSNANKKNSNLLKVIAVLSIMVVVMGGLFAYQLKRKKNLEMQGKLQVSVPVYNANSPNYIYLAQEKEFKGENLKLIKMSVDSEATVFYFNRDLDFMLHEVELNDKNGKNYNIDLSFVETNSEMKNSCVRFESLDTGIDEFTLSILDSNTEEKVSYTIVLKGDLEYIPTKYISNPITVVDAKNNVSLVLEDVMFATTGTTLNYRLNWKYDDGYIQLGWEDDSIDEVILVNEKNTALNISRSYPATYSFVEDNTIIGRMDFERVQNLNSKVDIKFKNIYWIKDMMDTEISLDNISYNTHGKDVKSKNITFGRYKLEFERFGIFENYAILVYNAKDLLMPEMEDNSNRVEAKIKAELVITDKIYDGVEAVVEGKCLSKQEGAQLTFDIGSVSEIVAKFSNPEYSLRVSYVGLKLDDEEISLDLSQLDDTTIQEDKEEIKDFVLEATEKRLAVKSLEIDKSELDKYFSDEILSDESIIRDYFKTTNLVGKAEYSAQILTMGKDREKYYAVVQEAWKGNEGIREVHFYRTHKMVISKIDGEWVVIEDFVVK